MQGQIVTISPKGQITIPMDERKDLPSNKLLFTRKDQTFILQPIEIRIVQEAQDDLAGFGSLSEQSFSFWDNEADDVYADFYDSKS